MMAAKKKKSSDALRLPLTMEQCKKVNAGLNKKIKNMSITDQMELSKFVAKKNKQALKHTGKELEKPERLYLIGFWISKGGKV